MKCFVLHMHHYSIINVFPVKKKLQLFSRKILVATTPELWVELKVGNLHRVRNKNILDIRFKGTILC